MNIFLPTSVVNLKEKQILIPVRFRIQVVFLGYWLWQIKNQRTTPLKKIIKIRHTPSIPLHLDIKSFGMNVSFLITFSTNQEFI